MNKESDTTHPLEKGLTVHPISIILVLFMYDFGSYYTLFWSSYELLNMDFRIFTLHVTIYCNLVTDGFGTCYGLMGTGEPVVCNSLSACSENLGRPFSAVQLDGPNLN